MLTKNLAVLREYNGKLRVNVTLEVNNYIKNKIKYNEHNVSYF